MIQKIEAGQARWITATKTSSNSLLGGIFRKPGGHFGDEGGGGGAKGGGERRGGMAREGEKERGGG